MEYIGIDVHNRYCQVAILDDDTEMTNPKECRLPTERAELEEFACEHDGANVAFEATRNYWFVYDCLNEHLDVTVANPHKTRLIADQKVKSDRLDAKRLIHFRILPAAKGYAATGVVARRGSSQETGSEWLPITCSKLNEP